MTERIWTEVSKDLAPENNTIVEAVVETWNKDLAVNRGFVDLIDDPSDFFYIATGKNCKGEVVGAKVLQNIKDRTLGDTQNTLLFLSRRAQQIFGLKIRAEVEDR